MMRDSLIAIILFYNKSHGIQARLSFSNEFKHCNVIVFDGKSWIILDFTRSGFEMKAVKVKDADNFIQHLRGIPEATAILSVAISCRQRIIWKPWLARSCNEISRYATGIDIGFTFNPSHFYSKLLKYNARRNYEILTHWRRQDGISRGRSGYERDRGTIKSAE